MQGAAAWLIVNVWPPIVIDPLRGFRVVFAATEYPTVPLPLPLPPLVTVIQDAPLTAFHVHPPGAVTETDPVLEAAGTLVLVGERLKLQVTPSCVTV